MKANIKYFHFWNILFACLRRHHIQHAWNYHVLKCNAVC